jgi:hypothetical protein
MSLFGEQALHPELCRLARRPASGPRSPGELANHLEERVSFAVEVLGAVRTHRRSRWVALARGRPGAPLDVAQTDRVVVEAQLRALRARVDHQGLGPVPAFPAIATFLPQLSRHDAGSYTAR